MDMSIPYEAVGRTRQKERTRGALIAAARDLVAQGTTPTVEHAAAAASISRTTAYRYFPNQPALLLAAHPEAESHSLLAAHAAGEPAARFDAVIEALTRLTVDTQRPQPTRL